MTTQPGSTQPVLQLKGISKAFGGHPALTDVQLALRSGEVHALMGENGAGKSTLIKILTGIYPADSGEMRLSGELIAPRTAIEAQWKGISTVYQEVNLVPALSVAENIYLGREPTRFGRIRWSEVNRRAQRALAPLGLSDIDVTRPLEDYSIAIQQMTAIARALDLKARVLVLDEATSSLDGHEVQRLFSVLRDLKANGMAILLVTHFLDQVYEISDRMTILRNGRWVGEYPTAELSRVELVSKMMGQELSQLHLPHAPAAKSDEGGPPAWLECEGLGRKGTIAPFHLKIRAGETLGLAGLLGSGRTETANVLFGKEPADQGSVRIDGRAVKLRQPRSAIRHGIALSPEDRKAQGIFPELSVRENIILALQARRGWFRFLSRRRQNELADRYIKAMRIRARDAEQPIQTLSGGNQQKALLARWLATDPRLFILDEPTRGIDVGAKAEIQKLMKELSTKGMSVLFISSELEEVVRCCDRVALLKDKRKFAELTGPEISEKNIMAQLAEVSS